MDPVTKQSPQIVQEKIKNLYSFEQKSVVNGQQKKQITEEVLYFMKGNFKHKLSEEQQKQIYRLFQVSKKQHSIFIYNSSELSRTFKNWKEKLYWITPYYAVKTNDSKQFLRDLATLGSNFDCACKNQIRDVLALGVKPNQIIYSNSVKDQNDLKWAASQNIQLTTADSIDELMKIKTIAPQMRVLWRISINEAADGHQSFISLKFGDDLQTQQEIHQRMKEIQKIGINLKGIHFHCGSKVMGTSNFSIAIKLARKCMEIGRIYNHQMDILDVGGGFPNSYLPESVVQDLKPTQKDPLNYKVIAQPGRHFSANCFYILVKIIGKKIKQNFLCYHINDSIYHSLNNFFLDTITCDDDESQFYSKIDCKQGITNGSPIQSFEASKIFGMTGCGLDIIMKNVISPTTLNRGDWISIGGMGAYTQAMKSKFNGMQSTTETLVWSPKEWIVQQSPIHKQARQN